MASSSIAILLTDLHVLDEMPQSAWRKLVVCDIVIKFCNFFYRGVARGGTGGICPPFSQSHVILSLLTI